MNNYNLLDILFLKKMIMFNQGSKIFGIYIYIYMDNNASEGWCSLVSFSTQGHQ